jgi:hypothetical protein
MATTLHISHLLHEQASAATTATAAVTAAAANAAGAADADVRAEPVRHDARQRPHPALVRQREQPGPAGLRVLQGARPGRDHGGDRPLLPVEVAAARPDQPLHHCRRGPQEEGATAATATAAAAAAATATAVAVDVVAAAAAVIAAAAAAAAAVSAAAAAMRGHGSQVVDDELAHRFQRHRLDELRHLRGGGEQRLQLRRTGAGAGAGGTTSPSGRQDATAQRPRPPALGGPKLGELGAEHGQLLHRSVLGISQQQQRLSGICCRHSILFFLFLFSFFCFLFCIAHVRRARRHRVVEHGSSDIFRAQLGLLVNVLTGVLVVVEFDKKAGQRSMGRGNGNPDGNRNRRHRRRCAGVSTAWCVCSSDCGNGIGHIGLLVVRRLKQWRVDCLCDCVKQPLGVLDHYIDLRHNVFERASIPTLHPSIIITTVGRLINVRKRLWHPTHLCGSKPFDTFFFTTSS